MPHYNKIEELNLRGRRVFVRLDLNVPLKKMEMPSKWQTTPALMAL